MTALARQFREFMGRQGGCWMVRAVLVVVLALLLSRALAWVLQGRVEANWDAYAGERASAYLEDAAREFTEEQRALRRMAVEVGSHTVVQEALRSQDEHRKELFDRVVRFSRDFGVGVEVYNRAGELAAWSGRSGVAQRREIRIAL